MHIKISTFSWKIHLEILYSFNMSKTGFKNPLNVIIDLPIKSMIIKICFVYYSTVIKG
jgi:hypothetical protein